MDEGDIAQDYQERHNRAAIAAARTTQVKNPSRTYCLDCECVIPDARRKAYPGCVRCVECEQEFETLRRR
jgi:phage/conjugal plasmid C-4 type zinc finger TraR family protein